VVHQGWLKHIRAGKSVYRIADALSGFKKTTPAILHLEQMLARSVDLVVYAARSLEAYVKALRHKLNDPGLISTVFGLGYKLESKAPTGQK
jgi:DNA-binding response OmpR family regulator